MRIISLIFFFVSFLNCYAQQEKNEKQNIYIFNHLENYLISQEIDSFIIFTENSGQFIETIFYDSLRKVFDTIICSGETKTVLILTKKYKGIRIYSQCNDMRFYFKDSSNIENYLLSNIDSLKLIKFLNENEFGFPVLLHNFTDTIRYSDNCDNNSSFFFSGKKYNLPSIEYWANSNKLYYSGLINKNAFCSKKTKGLSGMKNTEELLDLLLNIKH